MSKNKNNRFDDIHENKGTTVDDKAATEGIEITDVDPSASDADDTLQEITDEPVDELEALKNLLQQKEEEIEKEKKEYLFLMADFDNFRKRTLKEKSDLIKNGGESALKGLLPIIDDFERAIEANKDIEDASSIKEGVTLIYNKFLKYLEQNGVKAMETNGVDFDPDKHEALTTIPVDDEDKKNKIVDTVTKGYTLNDKVIRHAKVVVGN